MNRHHVISLVLLAGLLAVASARGQEDVFGGEAQPPAAPTPAPTDQPAKVEPAVKIDIVIETLRESNPSTPETLARAVQTMLDYGEPDEAKAYLDKLVALQPDVGVLLDLHRRFGSALFIQMAREPRLGPEGAKLSKDVLDAVRAAAFDSAKLQALIEQLKDPSESARKAAVVELHSAGQRAMPPLLNALADAQRASEHETLGDVMLELGNISIEPLIGALESPDEAFRGRVMDVLGRLRARSAVLHLIGPYHSTQSGVELKQAAKAALLRIVGETPAQYDAEQYLVRHAKRYLNGEPPRRPNFEGMIDLWHWDETQHVALPRRYLAQDAGLVLASRAAADLYSIAPTNPDYRRLYLTIGLELHKTLGGLDRPLSTGPGTVHDAAAAAGVDALEEILMRAIKENHVAAAAGACEVLGNIATPPILTTRREGQHPPLAQALRHGDRRLRFAAAMAVLRLDPREPYPGSSHMLETLGQAVATSGKHRALVVHPQAASAQSLVGLLNEIGFEADTAATGKRGFQMAAAGTDYELVLISDAVDRFDANELVQMLRRDPRTAKLPVGIMYRLDVQDRARRIAGNDPLTLAMARPHSTASITFEVTALLQRAGRNFVGPEERMAQGSVAIDALAHLAEHAETYPFYDLLRHEQELEKALLTPELSAKAAQVLGLVGSPRAQRALAGMAGQQALPLAQRQAAAAGFAEAVKRRGTLLTTSEIRNQYELYNQSETLDADTQAVLASILDAIESRAKGINTASVEKKEE